MNGALKLLRFGWLAGLPFAMNAENRHRRDEREFLEDFDRETARLLGDADHVVQIMEHEGERQRRSEAHSSSRRTLAKNRLKRKADRELIEQIKESFRANTAGLRTEIEGVRP